MRARSWARLVAAVAAHAAYAPGSWPSGWGGADLVL